MTNKKGRFWVYQGTEIEANGGEINRQHSEEIKSVSKPVYVSTHSLLTIPISYLCLKHRYLVKTDIPSFTNLYILMMSNISFT
jgi:hypothetical protein